MSTSAPAGWYPDPLGRHDHRYWDGGRWTHHVGKGGQQNIDPPLVNPHLPVQPTQQPWQRADSQPIAPDRHQSPKLQASQPNKKIQRQLRKLGVADGSEPGNDAWLDERVLVVHQKGKLLEVNAEYAVHDQHGRLVGGVREVGQSLAKKAMAPANRTRRFQVVDAEGRVLFSLTRPTVWVRSKLIVRGATGNEIGQIARTISLSFSRFRLESGGRPLGSIQGENGRQSDFSIQDATGAEIGRITRTNAGLVKEMLTKADNYVVEIHRPLEEPLRSLVMAAALAVDTALRQK